MSRSPSLQLVKPNYSTYVLTTITAQDIAVLELNSSGEPYELKQLDVVNGRSLSLL